jgi:peptidoglycan/LPS O-acetylase OafA/YrhL
MVFATLIFVLGLQLVVDLKHFVLGEMNESRIDSSFLTLLYAFGLFQIFSNAATLLNPPLWSLSAEWLCNFFVVSRPIFRRYNPSFFFVIGCLFIWHFQSSGNGWEEQFGRAISGFYFGMILRQAGNRESLGTRNRLVASLALVVFMNVSIYFVGSKLSYLSPLTYGLAIIQLSCVPIRPNSKIRKAARFLGRFSYGFYAWHFPLLSISGILIEKVSAQFYGSSVVSQHLTVLLCFTLTITFTHLTLKYLETPLRNHRARKIA